MDTNRSRTSVSLLDLMAPARYSAIRLSAVNTRFGRMLLSVRREPCSKSPESRSIASRSERSWLVIWHRITSCPSSATKTNAGRRFSMVRSENGNGMTTTSPPINPARRRPPRVSANPWLRPTH
jgi:hypothetical protein